MLVYKQHLCQRGCCCAVDNVSSSEEAQRAEGPASLFSAADKTWEMKPSDLWNFHSGRSDYSFIPDLESLSSSSLRVVEEI